jgi:carboxylesterase type B
MTNYINTSFGPLVGTFENDVYRFLGIPYAKAPI